MNSLMKRSTIFYYFTSTFVFSCATLINDDIAPDYASDHQTDIFQDDYAIHLTNDLTGRNSENGGDTQKTQKVLITLYTFFYHFNT